MTIPLWSETNPEAKKILYFMEKVEWNDLSQEDKKLIWKHMEGYLFNSVPDRSLNYYGGVETRYNFGGGGHQMEKYVKRFPIVAMALNNKYKKQSYARGFLNDRSYDTACHDFYRIFLNEERDVVFEMISIYCRVMVNTARDSFNQKDGESKIDYEKRVDEEQYREFDGFSKDLNDVFEQFGLEFKLTRNGFVHSDEPQITELVFKPALKKLSDKKWLPINTELRDAFEDLNKHSGSDAITHTISSLQAFLQIHIEGKTGKGSISQLIKDGQKNGQIPNDIFSSEIIKKLESFFAKERQDKGNAHPKKQRATDKEARLVINLVMVFIDYVL